MSAAKDVEQVHASFVGVVRALGLLRPDTTPCGQPLSLTHAHTISELHSDGPLSQQALGARLRLQKSTVSRLVDELVRDGTVKRQPNPADRRSVLITLSPAGRRKAERLRGAQTELFARLLADTPADDRRQLAGLLDRLARAARALD